jgi:S1-C subfamily serine protease
MEKAKLPPLERARVRNAVERVEQTRTFNPVAAPVDQEDDSIDRYNSACDELRKTLADLQLPDPGDALPPPKSARLDVSVRQEPLSGTVMVVHVLPHSRADKVGLQDDDVIRKINGKEVGDVKDLRRLVTENAKGLVMDVTRDGREIRLEEPK